MKGRNLLNLFIVLGFYIGAIVFIKNKFPNTEALIDAVKGLYLTHGYILIFFGAFLEAIFLLGFYVPGSTVVILGAAFAKTGVVSYPLVLLLGTLGLVLGYILNYLLGKYGWYHMLARLGFEKGIDVAKKKLIHSQSKTIILGYFSPSSASFISTAAGVLGIPFRRFLFLSIIAQSFWSFLWGTLAYWLGLPFVEFILKYFIFALLLIVAIASIALVASSILPLLTLR